MWNEKQMFTVFGKRKCLQIGDFSWGLRTASSASNELAGRYQGFHRCRNETRSFEVFWRSDGWWWWLRPAGCSPEGEAVGPFLTSTQAYRNATSQQMTQPNLPKLPMMKSDRHRP